MTDLEKLEQLLEDFKIESETERDKDGTIDVSWQDYSVLRGVHFTFTKSGVFEGIEIW